MIAPRFFIDDDSCGRTLFCFASSTWPQAAKIFLGTASDLKADIRILNPGISRLCKQCSVAPVPVSSVMLLLSEARCRFVHGNIVKTSSVKRRIVGANNSRQTGGRQSTCSNGICVARFGSGRTLLVEIGIIVGLAFEDRAPLHTSRNPTFRPLGTLLDAVAHLVAT